MTKKPLVSFIIRTKNEQRTIGKVLAALVKQTCQDFEIILVDDNSNDKTLAIVKKFSQKLPIQIIKLKPGEFSHPYSENLGASKAKGKYFCLLSGHSMPISNTWLTNGLSNFRNPKVAAISGYYSGIPIGYFCPKLGRLLFVGYQRQRKEYTRNMTNTNSLIRKNLWQKYPFDEKLPEAEDYDWAYEMLARGYNVISDPKFNVFHSHLLLGQRINWWARKKRWQKLVTQINKRQRPRQSFTRLKV